MSLAFKIDENLLGDVADLLRAAGHDVLTVLDQRLGGRSDETVAEFCRTEARALVTLDMDFADIRRYPPEDYAGFVVARPARQDVDQIVLVVGGLIGKFGSEPLAGRLWIADETTLRIRSGD